MRYDAEHKGQTRARLLKAAARTLRAEGPERISVSAVMGEAGLTHGGFYAHFKSKDELVAKAIEASFDEALGLLEMLTESQNPEAALRAYVDFYLSDRHRSARHTGCPVAALSTDVPRLPESGRGAFAKGVEDLIGRLEAMLAAAGRDAALARPVLTEMVGAVAIARAIDEIGARRLLELAHGDVCRRLSLEISA